MPVPGKHDAGESVHAWGGELWVESCPAELPGPFVKLDECPVVRPGPSTSFEPRMSSPRRGRHESEVRDVRGPLHLAKGAHLRVFPGPQFLQAVLGEVPGLSRVK